ncbi:MAG: mechanosensitive ion channel family protein, partial [Staphylothermus sp.]|nr:mechanosensitive ion channel family protein [Staphylothermus sp.]
MDGLNLSNISGLVKEINVLGILFSIILIVVGVFVASLLRMLLYKLFIRFFPEPTSRNVSRAIYYIIIFIVGVSALGYLGIDLTGFMVAGGIIGIILGFALQSITANLFSGLFIYWEKPFKPGDLVKIGNVEGWVTDLTVMSTKIVGFDGVKVRIPNRTVFESLISNYYATRVRRIEFVVGIAYKEDAEKAYEVLYDVVKKHPLVLVEPEPDIFVYELGDSGVNILVRVWVPSRWDLTYKVMKDLLWAMKKALTE